MTTTVTSEFRIKEIRKTDMAVKDLDTRLTAFVECEKRLYDSKLWKEIQEISAGQVVKMTVESQNDLDTIWEISEIQEIQN